MVVKIRWTEDSLAFSTHQLFVIETPLGCIVISGAQLSSCHKFAYFLVILIVSDAFILKFTFFSSLWDAGARLSGITRISARNESAWATSGPDPWGPEVCVKIGLTLRVQRRR